MFHFFLLFLLGCAPFGSALNLQYGEQNQAIVARITQEQPESIVSMDEDKVYLIHEKIQLLHDGIYLITKNSVIALPMLFSDANGCFLPVNASVYAKIRCRNCGYEYWYSPAQYKCPKCGLADLAEFF